jgi:hypothetical protein
VDNQIDTATGTLKCTATLAPEEGHLMLRGSFLKIHLVLEVKHGVTLVPSEAIQRAPEGRFVWAIKPDQTVSRRFVQMGTIDGAKAEIQSGLSPGDLVVIGPMMNLREGRRIRFNSTQNGATEILFPAKTIVLTRAATQLVGRGNGTRTVDVWTDTTTLPGESLRAFDNLNRRQLLTPLTQQFVNWDSGKVTISHSFGWWFLDSDGFGSNEAAAATAQIRERQTERPLALTAFTPLELFSVTNPLGVRLSGYVEFDHADPAPPDASGQVKAFVRIQGFQNGPGLGPGPYVTYSAEVPCARPPTPVVLLPRHRPDPMLVKAGGRHLFLI